MSDHSTEKGSSVIIHPFRLPETNIFEQSKTVNISFGPLDSGRVNVPTKEKEEKKNSIPFLFFLTPQGREILPQLVILMERPGTKPEDFAIMLFALQQLGLLQQGEVKGIDFKSILYKSIKYTFRSSKVGSYEALRKNLLRFQGASAADEVKIKAATGVISELLKENK